MISISNLSIHFANRYLFDNLTFTVGDNDRIGLIGRNGSGKSTLLRILSGQEKPETGIITKPNDFTIGYLPQESISLSDLSVYNEACTALETINQIESNIKNLSHQLDFRTDYESKEYLDISQKLSEANYRFNLLGGTQKEAKVETILTGLGFERDEFSRSLKELSGGWQMRVELAKILLKHPDCILLDEPTNHLDIDSIRWLENFLKNYNGSVLVVSHDRNLLDNVTNRTIEIVNGKIYDKNLSYSKFIELRNELKEHQASAYKNQQKQIAQTEKFIERFRFKANLASRVQSRIKQLDKVERIEQDEDDVSSIHFHFPDCIQPGIMVAEVQKLTKQYGEKIILDNINFSIERGEKVAFVGKNGEGKTTLTKILAGDESYKGTLNIGNNVKIGYFAQHQAEMLDNNSTVFEIIDNAATGDMRTRVRSLLGAFLFSGESVNKKVKVLSGGERSRLAIAKLLLQPINLLILDEPTNHLDMISKDVLKNALLSFKGALILVSHDREFLNGLTNKTVLFKNKTIKEFTGGIYNFLEKENLSFLSELETKKISKTETSDESIKTQESKTQIERDEKKRFSREENRLHKLISKSEEEIEKLENKISELESEFAKPDFYQDTIKAKNMTEKFEEFRNELAIKMEEWTNLHNQIEELHTSK